jgi:hypothetical protein
MIALSACGILRSLFLINCFSVLLLALPGESEAFRGMGTPSPVVSMGIRTGYAFDVDSWSLGGQLWLPIARGAVKFVPSGDLFFVDGRKYWQINVDAALSNRGPTYYGGGLAVTNMHFGETGSDETKLGFNLFVGHVIPLRRSSIRPFLEGRWTFIEGENPFRLVIGFNFRLGGRPGR